MTTFLDDNNDGIPSDDNDNGDDDNHDDGDGRPSGDDWDVENWVVGVCLHETPKCNV